MGKIKLINAAGNALQCYKKGMIRISINVYNVYVYSYVYISKVILFISLAMVDSFT